MCVKAARRHGTAPTATAALGRVLLGTLLMASFGKEEEEATQVRRVRETEEKCRLQDHPVSFS